MVCGEVLVVLHLVPAREQRRCGHALPVGVLDDHQPAGLEQSAGGLLDEPDDVEAVVSCEQRDLRVVVDDLGVGQVSLVRRDVRRVAGDQVELAGQVEEGVLDAAQVQVHLGVPGGHPVGGVAARPREGVRVALHRVHRGARDLVGQGEGDGAAAGAQIGKHG